MNEMESCASSCAAPTVDTRSLLMPKLLGRSCRRPRIRLGSKVMSDIIYAVRGRGKFPVDMLRYDRSCPWSETDSNIILKGIRGDTQDEYEVALYRSNAPKGWKPCVARWTSWGWTLITK